LNVLLDAPTRVTNFYLTQATIRIMRKIIQIELPEARVIKCIEMYLRIERPNAFASVENTYTMTKSKKPTK